MNDYFEDDDPYLDTINHYKKVVYYRIALGIQNYIVKNGGRENLEVNEDVLQAKEKTMIHRIAAKIYRSFIRK